MACIVGYFPLQHPASLSVAGKFDFDHVIQVPYLHSVLKAPVSVYRAILVFSTSPAHSVTWLSEVHYKSLGLRWSS